jgi:peptide/nickel transport system substrate-binding protein
VEGRGLSLASRVLQFGPRLIVDNRVATVRFVTIPGTNRRQSPSFPLLSHTFRWSITLAIGLALACTAEKKAPSLVVAFPSSPSTRFPNVASDEATLSVLNNVYETLVEVDPNLALRPGLAESWYAPDDSTWVFRLRADIRCHDGRTLRAGDVAKSLEHARADPASVERGQLADIREIETPDQRTVVLHTDRPSETLPAQLGNVLIWAPAPRAGDPGVGTGPYRVRSWTPGGDILLEAFPGHRGFPPSIPVVAFEAPLDPEEGARRLLRGQVHIVVDPSTEQLAALRGRPGFKAISRRGLRVLFLGMDDARQRTPYTDSSANPFRDRRVRQALALAIDRRKLADEVLHGFAEVVDQIASPDELGAFKDSVFVRPYDPAAARRLLSAAGYAHGFSVSFDFAKSPAIEPVAQALAKDLLQIGVRLILRPELEAQVIGRVERQDTSFYLLAWRSHTGDGRAAYESLLHSSVGGRGRVNGGGYSDGEMDLLIEKSYGPMTPNERRLVLARLANKVAVDVPIIPLLRTDDSYLLAGDLEFVPRLDRNIRVDEIRWKPRP